jgi:hypothetical protein
MSYLEILKISSQISLPDKKIEVYAIRAQGAGVQNDYKFLMAFIYVLILIRHFCTGFIKKSGWLYELQWAGHQSEKRQLYDSFRDCCIIPAFNYRY